LCISYQPIDKNGQMIVQQEKIFQSINACALMEDANEWLLLNAPLIEIVNREYQVAICFNDTTSERVTVYSLCYTYTGTPLDDYEFQKRIK
jgi:hypothetical protein